MAEFDQTVERLFYASGIDVDREFLKRRLRSHPNYPSLLSLTDTLEELEIDYAAAEVEKSQLSELEPPFMAHTSENHYDDYVIIENERQLKAQHDELMRIWDGIVIMVDGEAEPVDPELDEISKGAKRKKYSSYLLIGLSLLTLGFFQVNAHWTTWVISLFSIAAFLISRAIVLKGLGIDTTVAQKFCSEAEEGCDQVLQSELGKLWKGVGLGDLGVVYFAGLFLFLSLSTAFWPAATHLILLPCGLAWLFSWVSFYHQWRISKAWCKLCLATMAMVWCTAITLFWVPDITSLAVDINSLGLMLLSFLLPSLWLLVKGAIYERTEYSGYYTQLVRFKRNPYLFLERLQKQTHVQFQRWEDDLFFGNPNAGIQLLMVGNPLCHPCAEVHQVMDALLEKYGDDIGFTLRFFVRTGQLDGNRANTVRQILSVCRSAAPDKAKKMLSDWYEWIDLDKWSKVYGKGQADPKAIDQLVEKHAQWAAEARILQAPSLFFNGLLMPPENSAKDLILLMSRLKDMIQPTPQPTHSNPSPSPVHG